MPYDPNASLVPSATPEVDFTISSTVVTFDDFTNLTSYKDNSLITAYRVSVTGGDVRYLWDTDPTATEGHILSSASGYNTHDIHCNSFVRMRFIRVSADVSVTITPIHTSGENVWFDGYGLLDSVYSTTEVEELLAGVKSVKSSHTWSAATTAVDLLGTGQTLSATRRLVAVWLQPSATVSVFLGDEADADRYSGVTAIPLTTGEWENVFLVKHGWDGTNEQVLLAPSADYTGTINVEVVTSDY
jgi:hypothetical protein